MGQENKSLFMGFLSQGHGGHHAHISKIYFNLLKIMVFDGLFFSL